MTFTDADPNVAPKRDVPLWSETRWNGCWNPDAGVGLYLHCGRLRADLDVWWSQVVAYLPDGQLAVGRLFGANASSAGVETDTFSLRVTDGGWESSFDGVLELTDSAALARAPRGSSAPSSRVRWELTADSISPPWDPFAGVPTMEFAGDAHVQQASVSRGQLVVDGTTFSLDGLAFKDHSSGARSFDGWHSHSFVLAHLPHGILHAITLRKPDGTSTTLGALFRDGERVGTLSDFSLPLLSPAGFVPGDRPDAPLTVAGRGEMTLASELLAALPMTISEDNDNINGIDWELAGDPVILVEGIGRFDVPGQGVGYGMLERSVRRSMLPSPHSGGGEL